MKNFKYLLFLFLGCNSPIDDLEIGEPFSQSDAIIDEWTLDQVKHIDNADLNKSFIDVSSLFDDATLSIDESSFSYSQSSGPIFLETSGTWTFDDPEYPVYFLQNSSTQLKLGQAVRQSNNTLILILERKCEEKVISSYEYTFKRK